MSQPAKIVTARRSQEDRSKAMRKRLIKATIENLAEEGYSATTLSNIVRRAKVSRGAQVHHYSSKNDLIVDAAVYLLTRAYRRLGEVLLGVSEEDNRLRTLVFAGWDELFAQQSGNAFLELIIASQHEPELSRTLKQVYQHLAEVIGGPIHHYFERCDEGSESPIAMFRSAITLMTGLAASSSLLSAEETQAELELLYRTMSRHMRARKGVTTPPPAPKALSLSGL